MLDVFLEKIFAVRTHLAVFMYRVLKIIASLLSPTAFALGSINFADYERAHVGLRWSNIWRVSRVPGNVSAFLFIPLFNVSKVSGQYWYRHHLGWIFCSVSWWCCLTHCYTVWWVFIWIRYASGSVLSSKFEIMLLVLSQ